MKKIIFYIIIIMCIGTATYNIINIIKWKYDNNKNKEIINKIKIDKSNEIIDFDKLNNINKDIIGWIEIKNTNVNYPIVQTDNNSYYLNHSIDKRENNAGWIFLDYRNNINDLSKNNIIYGHSRKDKTMFGSLFNLLNKKWYENTDNHTIKIYTKDEILTWKIFSIYIIKTENYYTTTHFNTSKEFIKFINTISNRSIYNFSEQVTNNDKILTLSTCSGLYNKLVIHFKLISKTKT